MSASSNHTLREWIKFRLLRPALLGVGKAIAPFSTVGNPPVFKENQFAFTQLLEANWPAIRTELEQIMQFKDSLPSIQEIQQEQQVLNNDNKWKTFFLYGFGTRSETNCRLCPETAKTLEQIPGLLTAFFSIMYPNKHIPAHKGLFKGIVRTHLGMIIPDNNANEECRMQVHDQLIVWKEGKAVTFDDTYRHEVWNDANSIRVVLLIDTIRPFNNPFKWLNKKIIDLIIGSSHVKEAVHNHQTWERKFNQLFS
jgi:beta-hydroxylase